MNSTSLAIRPQLADSIIVYVMALVTLASPAMAGVVRVQSGEAMQVAVDRAEPGDVIVLAAGIHRINLRVSCRGRADAPIVIEGEPGAEIHGQMSWQPQWRRAEFGEGVYEARCPSEPNSLYYRGRIVLKCTDSQIRILCHGAEGSGFEHIGGVWGYAGGYVYLRTPNALEPQAGDVLVAAPNSACLNIRGAQHVTVRGLTLRYANYAALLRSSRHVRIEHCTVGPTDCGIRFGQQVHDSAVRYCDVACPAVMDWAGPSGNPQRARRAHRAIFNINMDHGPNNRTGIILFNSGSRNEIAHNFVHDCMEGIRAKEDRSEGGWDNNDNLEVHHNRIERTTYYGLCPNGSDRQGRWHHNLLVRNGIWGFRLKPPPTVGPLYVYRNVIVHDDSPIFLSTSADGAALIYQNTIIGPPAGISGESNGILMTANIAVSPSPQASVGDQTIARTRGLEPFRELCAVAMATGRDAGPDWPVLTAELRQRWPDLPSVLPGTKHVAGKADLGAFEDGYTDGEHAVGVDPLLCGAEVHWWRAVGQEPTGPGRKSGPSKGAARQAPFGLHPLRDD